MLSSSADSCVEWEFNIARNELLGNPSIFSMLDFRDVPNYWTFRLPPTIKANQGRLPVSTVGMKLSRLPYAATAISKAWKKWFINWDPQSAVDILPLNMADLAFALSQATNSAMSYADCLTYAQLYLHSTTGSANLVTKPFVARLPPYHRRAVDELLGVGMSFAVARYQGYIAFASKPDYDKLMGWYGVKWTRRWVGEDGPDVLALSSLGEFAFLEIKGRAKVCARTPVDFGKFKAQSLNARLQNLPTWHLLSYAYLPCGTLNDNVSVRWFNATINDDESAGRDPARRLERTGAYMMAALAVAYCHYQTIVRNAGRALPPSSADVSNDDWRFDKTSKVWVEHGPNAKPKLLVPLSTALIFNGIKNYFERFNRVRQRQASRAPLKRIYEDWLYVQDHNPQNLDERGASFIIMHRYGNGVCVVREVRRKRYYIA